MKILILTNKAGGLMSFRRELLEKLTESNEVTAALPLGKYKDDLIAIGVRPINLPVDRRGMNPIADLNLYFRYKKLIKEEKPDVVLTYTIKPNVYGGRAARKNKTPFIVNVTGLGSSIENGGLLSRLSVLLYKNGVKDANCVFFQNRQNMSFFRQMKIVGDNSRLIPGSGVNLDKHCFEEYPSEEDGVRFLFVGRIMRDKGIGELLEAFERLHEKHPEVSLDIIGGSDEDYTEKLKEAEGKGGVRYHGAQKDVHHFYMNSHCTVLPSYHEGTANVMLESASTGRPVITTRVPGCLETFDEGVTGFGCEAKDPQSLFEAMEKFLLLDHETKKHMGKAGREKMCREYDRKIVIDAYLEEIRKIKR